MKDLSQSKFKIYILMNGNGQVGNASAYVNIHNHLSTKNEHEFP